MDDGLRGAERLGQCIQVTMPNLKGLSIVFCVYDIDGPKDLPLILHSVSNLGLLSMEIRSMNRICNDCSLFSQMGSLKSLTLVGVPYLPDQANQLSSLKQLQELCLEDEQLAHLEDFFDRPFREPDINSVLAECPELTKLTLGLCPSELPLASASLLSLDLRTCSGHELLQLFVPSTRLPRLQKLHISELVSVHVRDLVLFAEASVLPAVCSCESIALDF